ncbi:MAG TPA: AMP-binding protein [Actinomycetes bacterium]|nr:AMP-binding protein [Actinomycetes bacterium]
MPESVHLLAVLLDRPAAAAEVALAWESGEAVAPLDPAAPAAELRRLLAALRPTHLVDRDGRRRVAGGVPAEAGVGAVVATSGTGGRPKLVELPADGIRASALAVSAALGVGPGDRWLCCLPLHAVAGLAIVARGLHTGVPVGVHERFDPAGVAAAAGEATLVSLVPTMLARLLAAGAPLGRFRRLLLGGGSVPAGPLAAARRLGARPVVTYGLTETFGGAVHDGHPLPGVGLRLGAGGEVELSGPMLMRGYRGDRPRTAAVLRDGWLRTGDLGRLGADGRLTVLGRRDDLIVTGGVNVHPVEVEAVLAAHPAVAEVAVAGRPDPEWGRRVAAWVVPRDPAAPPSLADLRAFAREWLAAAKLPRELTLAATLPRTPGGKLLRRALPGVAAQPPAGSRFA